MHTPTLLFLFLALTSLSIAKPPPKEPTKPKPTNICTIKPCNQCCHCIDVCFQVRKNTPFAHPLDATYVYA